MSRDIRFDLKSQDGINELFKRIKYSYFKVTKRIDGFEDCAQEIYSRMLAGKHQHATIDQAVIDYLRSNCNPKGFRSSSTSRDRPIEITIKPEHIDGHIKYSHGRDLVDGINDNRNRDALKSMIDSMPFKKRMVMQHYLDDVVMSKIAEIVNLTESRVPNS